MRDADAGACASCLILHGQIASDWCVSAMWLVGVDEQARSRDWLWATDKFAWRGACPQPCLCQMSYGNRTTNRPVT